VAGLFACVLAAAGVAACQDCHATPASSSPGAHFDGTPTVRLYFVSDLAGALEPCGCTKDQLGGLDHAAAWMRQRAQSDRLRGSTARSCSARQAEVGPPNKHPKEDLCLGCHHPPHVEEFDAKARMSSILGPGHGV